MIRGIQGAVVWAKSEKSDSHLLDYLFGVINGKREKMVSLAASAELSFPGIYGQKNNDQ